MIRHFLSSDAPAARAVHQASGLPENCFPDLFLENGARNPLFVVNAMYEHEGKPAVLSFLKITSEVYVLVDHSVGTPAERFEWMKELKEFMRQEAWKIGLDQMSCWIPTNVEPSFAKRLEELGFVRSPWQSWTLNIE